MLAFLLLTSWFQEVASAPSPAGAAAHVLLREESVTVEASGRQTTTTRGAIRILTDAGARFARAGVAYDAANGKLLEFRAWVQAPDGEPLEIAVDAFTDRSLSQGELRSALRQRQVEVAAEPGSVFFYQSTVVADAAFPQVEYEFQENELPVRFSRFRLSAPTTWAIRPVSFSASPTRTGDTWELRDLRANPPALPRLALTLLPDSAALPAFDTWSSVAAWLGNLAEPAARPSPMVAAQARTITAGLSTDRERIEALSAFVQGLRYVAVNENLGQGGGFTPSPAEAVLARGYGDCKDKSTLLRALLRAMNINSWLVAINSTDRARVRPEWPSPRVFNHAIVAIETGSKLLYFDPSDPYGAVGQLPSAQQGALALVLRPGATLEATPEHPGELERKVFLRLEEDGRVTGRMLESLRGPAAAEKRALLVPESYDKGLGRWLNAKVTDLKVQDSFPRDELHLYVQFQQESKLGAAGNLFVWKPLLPWGPAGAHAAIHETVEIEFHSRWIVEEMPEPVQTTTFSAAWFLRDGKLVIDRQLRAAAGGAVAVEHLPVVLRGLH